MKYHREKMRMRQSETRTCPMNGLVAVGVEEGTSGHRQIVVALYIETLIGERIHSTPVERQRGLRRALDEGIQQAAVDRACFAVRGDEEDIRPIRLLQMVERRRVVVDGAQLEEYQFRIPVT